MSVMEIIEKNLEGKVFEKEKKLEYIKHWVEENNIQFNNDEYQQSYLKNIVSILLKCSELEHKYNISILNNNDGIISKKFSSELFTGTIKNQRNIYSIIKGYVLYFDPTNKLSHIYKPKIESISEIDIQNIKNTYPKDLNDLIDCLNEITGEIILKSMHLTARIVTLLIYNGVPFDHVVMLQRTDYNQENGIVSYKIDDEYFEFELYSDVKTELDYYLGLNYLVNSEDKKFFLERDAYLISSIRKQKFKRGIEQETFEQRKRSFGNKIANLNKDIQSTNIFNIKLITPSNIYISGFFYKIYQDELNNISIENSIKSLTRTLMSEYEKWVCIYHQ